MNIMTLNEFTNVIKSVEFFSDLDYEYEFLQMLFKYCDQKTYAKESVIIKEGDFGDTMFIVLSGKVKIEKQTNIGDTYTVIIIDCKTSHPLFGEIALIESTKRSATVRAVEECSCLSINKQSFEEITNIFPKQGVRMLRQIATSLSRNLRKTTEDMLTLFDALLMELGNE